MMKRKVFICTCMLLIYSSYATAQEIFIIAYKGTVTFNDGRILDHNFRYALDRGVSVVFEMGSSALLFAKDKYFSVEKIAIKTTYSYKDFVTTFNTTSFQKNNGFIAYLQKTHMYATEVKESSKGAVIAGGKGIDNNNGRLVRDINETIFPQDSVRILTNTVHLKWETAAKTFGTKLMVVNSQLNDTIHNGQVSNKGELDLAIEKEGVYKWFLFSKLENKKSIVRVIIKPSVAETAKIRNELVNFKKQIAAFDEDLRLLVLDDYLYQNRIIE